MPLVDLPANAVLDTVPAQTAGKRLVDLPADAQLDAPQVSGWMRYPAMAGSYLAKGLAETLQAAGPATWSQMYGGGNSPEGVPPPDPQSLVNLGAKAGAVNRPDLRPQSRGENLFAAGAEGLGSALPQLAMGGGLAAALKGALQSIAGGVGGEAAAEALPNHPDAARILGGLGAAGATGAGLAGVNKVTGALAGKSSPAVEAYRRLGIAPELLGDISGRPTWQMIQAFASRAPGGAGRVHAASERAVHGFGGAIEDTASKLGTSRTLQEAGTALQQGSLNWFNNWKTAQKTAEDALNTVMPQRAPVDISAFADLASDANRIKGGPHLSAVLSDPEFRQLSKAALADAGPYRDAARKAIAALSGAKSPDLAGTAETLGIGPAGMPQVEAATKGLAGWSPLFNRYDTGKLLPWETARDLRSKIGEQIERSLMARDGKAAGWRRLYGAISDAMGQTAEQAGALPQWQQANQITREGHQFIESTLGDFINHRNPAQNTIRPEDAATAALSGMRRGGSGLADVRAQMPKAADELAAYKLRSMGQAVPSSQNATQSGISPGTFLTNLAFQRLAPEARDALFGNNPEVGQRIQDLATVAGSMRNTERFLNRSNTGTHEATGHAVGHLLSLPTILGGYEAGGVPGALAGWAAGAAAPWLTGNAAARMTSTPAVTSLLTSPGLASLPAAGPLSSPALWSALRQSLPGVGP